MSLLKGRSQLDGISLAPSALHTSKTEVKFDETCICIPYVEYDYSNVPLLDICNIWFIVI